MSIIILRIMWIDPSENVICKLLQLETWQKEIGKFTTGRCESDTFLWKAFSRLLEFVCYSHESGRIFKWSERSKRTHLPYQTLWWMIWIVRCSAKLEYIIHWDFFKENIFFRKMVQCRLLCHQNNCIQLYDWFEMSKIAQKSTRLLL